MSVGYADDEEDPLKPEEISPGGLDQFDEDQAIANLANVGQTPPGTPDVTPAPDIAAPDIQAAQAPALPEISPAPQQGGSEPGGPHTPDSAGSTPAPATSELQPGQGGVDVTVFPPGGTKPGAEGAPMLPQFEELKPLPPRPVPTGDPAKDIAAATAYHQIVDERAAELQRRHGALAQFAVQVGAQKGRKEAEVAAVDAQRRKEAAATYLAEKQRRATAIDDAVTARMSAYKDLEGAKWDKPHTGGEIFALIVSGIGAAWQNAGAAQLGQVGHAENEAAKSIATKMQREYDAKKLKVQAAGDAVLAAQYGYKMPEENNRAAMNALDAEMAAKYKLAAKEASDLLAQAGAPQAAINSDLIVTTNLQKSLDHEQQIHDREEQRANGAAHNLAMENIARATLGQRGSEHVESMDERQREFNLRRADSEEARRAREEERKAREDAKKDAAAAKKAAADTNLEVRDAGGNVRGYAPSSRVVKPVQDRLIQYDDAIKSTEDLLAYRKANPILGSFPTGDRYDRAVLAVAATTQANSSDATTAHEAGTLKQFGLVSDDGIKRTLEHLKKRQAAFLKQLRPVEGGAPDKAGPDNAKIERAWKVYQDAKQDPKERKGAMNYLIQTGQMPGG